MAAAQSFTYTPTIFFHTKNRAFELASARYEELKPVLDRLNELEEEQVRG